MLVLYTNIPHKDYTFHAPLLPKYPQQAQVEEDVMPGGHSRIQYVESKLDNHSLPAVYIYPYSMITFRRIRDFLLACGTEFQHQWKLFLKSYQEGQEPIELKNCYYYYLYLGDSLLKLENTDLLFQTFIQEVHKGLSEKSKNSAKGTLLFSYLSEAANKKFESRKELEHAIRNILALALQRDRNPLSFFSTTTSGHKAHALLQKPEYAPLAKLILGSTEHSLRYRDLRMFVLGENDTTYFYEKNRLRTYNSIFKAASPAERPSFITDLTTSYFNY